MRAFPEWSKLPSLVQEVLGGSEDYLTSRTIGLLRYCSPETVAAVFRGVGVAWPDEKEVVEIVLWPFLDHSPPAISAHVGLQHCEPDAAVTGATMAFVIEAKFIGSALGHYTSQLGREWLIGDLLARQRGWAGARLVMITADGAEPLVPQWGSPHATVSVAEQISAFIADMASRGVPMAVPSAAAIAPTLVWFSWSRLARAAAGAVGQASAGDRRVLLDVVAALEIMGCTGFSGWHLDELPDLPAVPAQLLLGVEDEAVLTFAGMASLIPAPANLGGGLLGLAAGANLLSFPGLGPLLPLTVASGGPILGALDG